MEERSHGCCTRMHQFHGANPQAVIRVGAWRLKISDQTSGEGWSLNGFPGLVDALFYGRGAFPAPCGVEPGRGLTAFLTASRKVWLDG